MGAEPLQFPGFKDGDGDEPRDNFTHNLIIEPVLNGFIMRIVSSDEEGEDEYTQVYHYQGKGDSGPVGMLRDLIRTLGLQNKVTFPTERVIETIKDS